jgi:hypothetical protein
MNKLRLLFLFLILSVAVQAQDRIIKLESLAAKTEKSDAELLISDHTIDGRSITKSGYELVITGIGSRGLVFKNFHGSSGKDPVRIIFRNAFITMSSNSVVIKMNANDWYVDLVCDNCKLTALPGGGASQVIYWEGDFNKGARVIGFDIDQGRPIKTMETSGGSAIQFAGAYSSRCNVTNWPGYEYIDIIKTKVRGANDEVAYIGHNNITDGYGPVKTGVVTIEDLDGDGSGRECIQITNSDSSFIRRAKCRNASLEKDNLHWSSLSLNEANKYVLVEDSYFEGAAQPVFAGALKVSGSTTFRNNTFIQRTDYTAPSALYLKGTDKYTYTLENNTITAATIAITADGSPVSLIADSNTITATTLKRIFNAGSVFNYTPPPTTTKTVGELIIIETRDYTGKVIETKYYYGSQELIKL